MTKSEKLLEFINEIRSEKDLDKLSLVSPEMRLRDDLNLQSLDLATLTVMIEDEFDVDVFENGIVSTIGEVLDRIA